MISDWRDHLDSISTTLYDYREGQIPGRTPTLVEQWASQFPAATREAFLAALDRTLKRTYISKQRLHAQLERIAATDYSQGNNDPLAFWSNANVLDIQQGGRSQHDLLQTFADIVRRLHGVDILSPGNRRGPYIYIDDIIATGSRIRRDLYVWLQSISPARVTVFAIAPVICSSTYWVQDNLNRSLQSAGCHVDLRFSPTIQRLVETRKRYRDNSDVLWPAALPNHNATQSYREKLTQNGYQPVVRSRGQHGLLNFFESDDDKVQLETHLLTRGCDILEENTNLHDMHRPLGFNRLATLGMVLMTIPFRNCPNSAPIALWVGSDTIPALLPRTTNAESRS